MAPPDASTGPPTPHRARPVALGALGAGLLLVVVHALSGPGAVQDWTYLAVGAGASAAAWLGALHGGRRLVPALIAAGVTLTALGDTVNQVLIWVRPVAPDLSAADVAWTSSYLVLVAALLLLLRRGSEAGLDLDGWIDLGAVSVVAVLVQWELSVHDLATDATLAPMARFVWILYPALDGVLLVLVARALLSAHLRTRPALLLALGVGFWLVADVAFTVVVPDGHSDPRIDVGWLLGSIALAAAAWQPRMVTRPSTPAEELAADRPGYSRALIGLLPLAVPGIIELVGHLRGVDPNPIPTFASGVVLLGLAFLRLVRLMQSDFRSRGLLHRQELLARTIADASSDAVALVGRDARLVHDSPRLAALLGYAGTDLRGHDLFTAVDLDDIEGARALFEEAVRSPGRVISGELRVRHTSGATVWLGVREVSLLDDPSVGVVVVTLHDVTARRSAQDELAHQALHDVLTGLANRALFADRVQQALRRAARTGQRPAIIFLDLDGFKTVNDSLGHGAGDELLCEVGRRLAGAVRPGDTVARMGGDEFAVLIEPSEWPMHDAEVAADRILRVLVPPVGLGDQLVSVSASLGLAVGEAGATSASMLRDADVAMYRAKAEGRGRWVAYDGAMRTASVERLQLEADLAEALDAGQLALVYQPVLELATDRVVGFEALLRWHHPQLGLLLPEQFLPVAEDSGLIGPIGAWVVREASSTVGRWHRTFPSQSRLTMSVNLSAREVAWVELLPVLEAALGDSGVDPDTFVVEVTERTLIRDPHLAAEQLRGIHDLGIHIAVDDFGTGYSTLGYLRMFPIDILKIDSCFVAGIVDADTVPPIVAGVLDLAAALDIKTLGEGVEREVQRDCLRRASCDLGQGFLLGGPMDTADAEALLLHLEPSVHG